MPRLPRLTAETESVIGTIMQWGSASLSSRDLVLAVIPAVESRVDDILRAVVVESHIQTSALGAFLTASHLESHFQTWAEREKLMTVLLDLSLGGIEVGQAFRLLVEVRNAIMHGNGRLTNRQVKSVKSLSTMKRQLKTMLSIDVDGLGLLLDHLDRSRVCRTAADYLTMVDVAASLVQDT